MDNPIYPIFEELDTVITCSEVKQAIKCLKRGKAASTDEIKYK